MENNKFMLVFVNKEENYMMPVALTNEQQIELEKLLNSFDDIKIINKKYPRKIGVKNITI